MGAIKRTWSLKGSVQLLSLNDGFFLLRFSCVEDFDMVWSRGVWFLLGKPFVLQKWHPKFVPKKEDFATVPIWVKIHDLPLACWNSEGISRIASKIGIPVVADNLTEMKTRLTYARVCVLVDCNALYPEEIKVSLNGDVVTLKVQYEWRPFPCEHCKSLMHLSSACPSKPNLDSNPQNKELPSKRGRSQSRKPCFRPHSRPQNTSMSPVINVVLQNPTTNTTVPSSEYLQDIPNTSGPLYQPHSPSPHKSRVITVNTIQDAPPKLGDAIISGIPEIPNLNSPND
ncbi:uncharacterized protein LOC110094606, partial [Dendrobium catenatum]|uniref:uncharacterized protein LOC110094606 n=1 Tax=Dendrobium catenatum TaxID=906689 RepID=UPI0009F2BCA8